MLIRIIESFVRLRNPDFSFDPKIPASHLLELTVRKLICHLRAYRTLLRFRFPGTLFLGRGVSIEGASNIRWGKWVRIDSYSLLSSYGREASLTIGNNVSIGSFSKLVVSFSFAELGKSIVLGNNVGLGDFAHIGGGGGVEIGDGTIIGPFFSAHPSNHIFSDTSISIRLQGTTRKGIRIGRNCWFGAKVTVLDGVTIGDDCVIAAGCVVNIDIPSGSLAAGVPARVIRHIK